METTLRAEFREFAATEIAPHAAAVDRDEQYPDSLLEKVAQRGYLAPWLSERNGGRDFDALSLGLLHEEIGTVCTATRSLLTAHGMVVQALDRWGQDGRKSELLGGLASGGKIGAFALTEPNIGSDAANPQTVARKVDGGYRLNGEKRWITFAQRADVFLILAAVEDKPAAFIVTRDNPGLTVEPMEGLMGARGAMLASLKLDDCHVEDADLLGKVGFGFTMVAASALDLGRYSIAWGCTGLLRACMEATVAYTSEREQFGVELRKHQLVAQKITHMMTAYRCADLLCRRAAMLRERRDHTAVQETMIAKYYASTAAMQVANDAVQLHGANGVSDEYPVARFFRDAKIMEIIEGSTQILEMVIARFAQTEAAPVVPDTQPAANA